MRLIVSVSSSLLMLLLLVTLLPAQAKGPRCVDITPLDPPISPEFCGCTWGTVLYEGQPVSGATVSLTFNNQTITSTSSLTDTEVVSGTLPFYHFNGLTVTQLLGVIEGDIVTLTATYNNETITQTIRALPEPEENNVEINLVFPWSEYPEYVVANYTQTVVITDQVAWLGGESGIMQLDLSTGMTTSYPLSSIRDIALTADGVWAIGADSVYQWDGAQWMTHDSPLSLPLFKIQSDSMGRIAVAGRNNSSGEVAVWENGSWSSPTQIPSPITELIYDENGELWIATWGNGVYHQRATELIRYTVVDGLPSNKVWSMVRSGHALFFGTEPVQHSVYGNLGGIGRYDLDTTEWTTYTETNGLLPDPLLPNSPMAVQKLTVSADGDIFAQQGTNNLFRFVPPATWEPAPQLLASAEFIAERFAGDAFILPPDQWDIFSTLPPTATINTAEWDQNQLKLVGDAKDYDGSEEMANVVWKSDDTIICYGISCTTTIQPSNIQTHTITVDVQNKIGQWESSAPVVVGPVPTSIMLRQTKITPNAMGWMTLSVLSIYVVGTLSYRLIIRKK